MTSAPPWKWPSGLSPKPFRSQSRKVFSSNKNLGTFPTRIKLFCFLFEKELFLCFKNDNNLNLSLKMVFRAARIIKLYLIISLETLDQVVDGGHARSVVGRWAGQHGRRGWRCTSFGVIPKTENNLFLTTIFYNFFIAVKKERKGSQYKRMVVAFLIPFFSVQPQKCNRILWMNGRNTKRLFTTLLSINSVWTRRKKCEEAEWRRLEEGKKAFERRGRRTPEAAATAVGAASLAADTAVAAASLAAAAHSRHRLRCCRRRRQMPPLRGIKLLFYVLVRVVNNFIMRNSREGSD